MSEPATPPFDLRAFSAENRKRCEHPQGFRHDLQSWSESDWITAALGELGEAANVVKKLNRIRDGIPNLEAKAELMKKLESEIADTAIYLDLFCQKLGIDFASAIRKTFDKKSRDIGYHPEEL